MDFRGSSSGLNPKGCGRSGEGESVEVWCGAGMRLAE